MSKRALILVEGYTEERFVKDVLAPSFIQMKLYLSPTLLTTKKVKDGPNFKGGVTNFAKFENDVQRLLRGAGNALVTSLIDYYGLPNDFPGMATRPNGSPIQRVEHVEAAITQYFGNRPNFIPFLVLHEFEAWLFSSVEELPRIMTQTEKKEALAAIRAEVSSPEEINERPDFAPSKRILSLFPGYRKKLHGPITAARIGIDKIRTECPHFSWWLNKLEHYAL